MSNGIEPADVEAIMIGLFNADWKLDQLVATLSERTMARKRKKIPPEVWAEWERGQRLLEERIASYRRKSAAERAASTDKPQT